MWWILLQAVDMSKREVRAAGQRKPQAQGVLEGFHAGTGQDDMSPIEQNLHAAERERSICDESSRVNLDKVSLSGSTSLPLHTRARSVACCLLLWLEQAKRC